MKAGISPDDTAIHWEACLARWLRDPITQSLLISLALHLAIAVVFQPVPGVSVSQPLVINARLQQVDSRSEPVQSSQVDAEEPVVEVQPKASENILVASTSSPAVPVKESPAPPMPSPVPIPAAAPATASVPVNATSTGPSPSISPSLPIGIDTTWYQARQVDHHPKSIGRIEPAYPEEAKRRNIEGTLKLMLKIDDLGRVQSAEVVEATPPGVFDEVALEAFRGAHFQPAMKDGRPVRYQAYMRVEFKLKD
jgi:protein TonB